MLKNILKSVITVAIGGHMRPDGDCVGSCMGLYQYIQNNFKEVEVDVYLEDIPEAYKFVAGTQNIRHEITGEKIYDLFITLDCGDEQRLGFSMPLFQQAAKTFCIDHHISNQQFADENYIVSDASSTSELVYNLLEKDKITKEIAEALYLGIVHDTGVFQYSCTSPDTLRAAANLLATGIDAPTLIDSTYYEKTYAQNQILGYALMESRLLLDGTCITSAITKEQLDFYKVDSKDLDGIVSQLRTTQGVEVAIFMYETEPGIMKVSLRSKKVVDVSVIAQCFGGGGHVRAAGFSIAGSVPEISEQLLPHIEEQWKKSEEGTQA